MIFGVEILDLMGKFINNIKKIGRKFWKDFENS